MWAGHVMPMAQKYIIHHFYVKRRCHAIKQWKNTCYKLYIVFVCVWMGEGSIFKIRIVVIDFLNSVLPKIHVPEPNDLPTY